MRRFVSIACLGVLSLSCTCVLAQHADDGSRTPVDPDAGTKGVIQTPDDVMDRMIGVWQRASQAQTDDESTQVSEQLGICQIQVQDLHDGDPVFL